jgi:hypothetical protein
MDHPAAKYEKKRSKAPPVKSTNQAVQAGK